jgi:2,3-bisphosphoglycerate-independent phosphoglycerate mutase
MTQNSKPGGETAVRRKCIMFIIDGLGDLPHPDLDGRTPLEAAATPVLDYMAGSGWCGLIDPIAPGKVPNTHSGTGILMGLLPEQVKDLNRGPVEAAGAGKILTKGDVAIRANFATVRPVKGGFLVTDRRADRITSGTRELATGLSDVDLGDNIRASLVSTDQHRGVLILSGPGLSAAVTDTDPGNVDMPAAMKACRPSNPGGALTAAKINRFIDLAHQQLENHPVNTARLSHGQMPANGIITRGAGLQFDVDSILHKLGIRAAMISGCNTVLGLSHFFGMDVIEDARFTADLETDLDAKLAAAKATLRDHDMVFVHVKAPDLCSHDRQPLAKRDFLQRLDAAMKPLLDSGVIVAVGADHTTDSNSGFHTADPVPSLIWQRGAGLPESTLNFGESGCRNGNMGRQLSSEFLTRILRLMGY